VFTAHPSGDVVAMGSTGRSQRRRVPVDEADRRAGALVLWRPLSR
jgi:hypothetical protein